MPTERVNIASNGKEGNNWTFHPSISGDGRYVAFYSYTDYLVPGDTNGEWDIFLHDRETKEITRISVASDGTEANGASFDPSISADGSYVAFESEASNLVPDDNNGVKDIFVYEVKTGETTRVNVSSDSEEGNFEANDPSISGDGGYVTFSSYADNLVPGDTNQEEDVFVRDRQTGETTRASVSSDGAQTKGFFSGSYTPVISANGRHVAFVSAADNLVPGDKGGLGDVFVRDLQTGETKRVSVSSDGTQGNDWSGRPSISANGRYIAFESDADNLSNHWGNIFVRDTKKGTTTNIKNTSGGSRATISGDGRYVAFSSSGNYLVAGDTNEASDVFVRDLKTKKTIRVSVASDGTEANGDSGPDLAISSDGQYIAFKSEANNLVSDDTNSSGDIFVHDRGLTPEPTNIGNNQDNELTGSNSKDTLNGKGGNDTLIGGGGKDILKGGKGNDTYQLDAKTASGSRIIDTQGNDVLELDKANISLDGLAKGKTGVTSKGKDLIIDINADGKAKGKQDLTVKNFFANKKANKPGKGFIETVDNVTGEEIIDALNDSSNGGIVKKGNNKKNTLKGKGKDDNLDGQGGSDKLLGNGGSDILTGGNGNDTLNGGSGDDTLTGGKGRDSFAFTTKGKYSQEAMGEDTITDFIVGQDKLSLDSDTFARLKPNQDFSKQFATVTRDKAAATSDAYIVYNSNNGHLFYNANGDKPGMGAGGQFATLDGAPELDANDFNLV